MKILLTGSTGFVGRRVLLSMQQGGASIVCAVRCGNDSSPNTVKVGEINSLTDWSAALHGIDCIVHLAARAHVMSDNENDPLSIYREVNTAGTLNLARQAAAAGVKRFVFISSIKVNGESTTAAPTFTENDAVTSCDPYAVSKAEAEAGLRLIANETGMDVVIIRPPLVYGPGVKANFLNLMKLAKTSLPLPFGAANNKRSMIYVGNLVDFITQCVDHPAAANQIFLVADGQDLSLRELLVQLRFAMGKPARLIPLPVLLFTLVGKLSGKQMLVDRLVGNLQVDPSKAYNLLAWEPPFTVAQGIQATVNDFLKADK